MLRFDAFITKLTRYADELPKNANQNTIFSINPSQHLPDRVDTTHVNAKMIASAFKAMIKFYGFNLANGEILFNEHNNMAQNIPSFTAQIGSGVSALSYNHEQLSFIIPTMKEVSVRHLLGLLEHEAVHMIRGLNATQTMNGLIGSNYYFLEEGIAKTLENMVREEPISTTYVSPQLPTLVMRDICSSYEEYQDFLFLFYKIKGRTSAHAYTKSWKEYIRKMKNFPAKNINCLNSKSTLSYLSIGMNKDMAYTQGVHTVLNILQSNQHIPHTDDSYLGINDLFAAKLAPSDLYKYKKENKGHDSYDQPIIRTKLFSERIAWRMSDLNIPITTYIQNKYNPLFGPAEVYKLLQYRDSCDISTKYVDYVISLFSSNGTTSHHA